MISAWWLLLIVPVAFSGGFLGGSCWMLLHIFEEK